MKSCSFGCLTGLCYLRLADNSRAREALRQCLPEALKNPELHASLKDDPATKKWLMQLLHAVGDAQQQQQNPALPQA
ncbi:Rcd1-like protein, related [Eimeria brunetti]|uniref:Rcd1-like protein, related n=1 Tax=Eimeria brunetti TaxID=51314 RepID=U6LLW1_9EIME|nr:Rcd1-like protein, related [Eimeria brunetti]